MEAVTNKSESMYSRWFGLGGSKRVEGRHCN
jgi:hypothetical protein